MESKAAGGFEVIEHTADAGIVAYGSDFKELFVNAAKGLFTIIASMDNVRETERREVEAEAPDSEALLIEWLNRLVFVFDVENLLLKRFEISEISDTRVRATCFGELIDASRHELRTGVKAATYHALKIDHGVDGYKARVIFDL